MKRCFTLILPHIVSMQTIARKETCATAGETCFVIRIIVQASHIIKKTFRMNFLQILKSMQKVAIIVISEVPLQFIAKISEKIILKTHTGAMQIINHVITALSAIVNIHIVILQTIKSAQNTPTTDIKIIAQFPMRAFRSEE